jgi:hypothetical protein
MCLCNSHEKLHLRLFATIALALRPEVLTMATVCSYLRCDVVLVDRHLEGNRFPRNTEYLSTKPIRIWLVQGNVTNAGFLTLADDQKLLSNGILISPGTVGLGALGNTAEYKSRLQLGECRCSLYRVEKLPAVCPQI